MYYGHLNVPNFNPIITEVQPKGKGFSLRVQSRVTGYDRWHSLTETVNLVRSISSQYYMYKACWSVLSQSKLHVVQYIAADISSNRCVLV